MTGAWERLSAYLDEKVKKEREKESTRVLALAHAINAGSTEEGRAVASLLVTMGWRKP